MQALPIEIGTLHFVGIGGIGMSGIAEVMHNLGYQVQGSDIAENANVKRLKDLGIPIHVGHAAENLGEARVLVVSTAIDPQNPELVAARKAMIPVVRRAEMLAELMRLKWSIAVAGTHGKTTTTSLIACLLDGASMDPTVINGGIINAYGTNARLGEGDWMVVEADESDGTFNRLPATIAVITNIDPEHLDFYGDYDRLKEAFLRFADSIPFYGFAALCIDHAAVQQLIPHLPDRRIVTYGFSPAAHVRAINLTMSPEGAVFDVAVLNRISGEERTIRSVHVPMFGEHNIQNTLGAIAVALEMGVEDSTVRAALANFSGVKRRFTKVGTGAGITVIDDYAHHPVEIEAVLKAGRSATTGRVIAVVQPHRYSRLQSLFEDFCTCFNDADHVVVADVYAAGESPLPGFDRDGLISGLLAHGHPNVTSLLEPRLLAAVIHEIAQPGDLVVCLGAGSITTWAQALPGGLEALEAEQTRGVGT